MAAIPVLTRRAGAGSARVYAIGVPWSYSDMCFPTEADTEAMKMRGKA